MIPYTELQEKIIKSFSLREFVFGNGVSKGALFFFFLSHSIYPLFQHDRAVVATQRGDLLHAEQLMNQVVVDKPHDAQTLYDAGVVAYKQGKYQQAQAYFTNAAKQSGSARHQVLLEKALFNQGNSNVKLNNLQQALTDYESVLKLNAQNEKARHNLEIVKKMLEEQQRQKQEEQKQQEDKRDQEKKDKQQDKGEQKNTDNKEQQNPHTKNNDKQPSSSGDKEQRPKDTDKKEPSQKNQPNKEKSEQRPGQDHKNEQPTEQKKSTGSGQNKKPGESTSQHIDAQLASILQAQEKDDANLNKQLIKALACEGSGGHDEQNCW